MDPYITGSAIRSLREKTGMTQSGLGEKLGVSDKTVSKWETGKGYPDITLLEPIAGAFRVSVLELLSGSTVANKNTSGNMLRGRFYVCPVCGNVIHSMGEAVISCHGITLPPMEPEGPEREHAITVEPSEDELYVRIDHPMTREHHISFIAAVSCDTVQIKKLYPEGEAHARFKRNLTERILWCCNRDGMFCTRP